MCIEAPGAEGVAQAGYQRHIKRPRPAVLKGTTRKLRSAMGDVFVTINVDESGEPFEVFAAVGKAGSALMADVEAICRLASLGLRFCVPVEEIYQQLRGISSDRTSGFGATKVLSVADAIAQAIGHFRPTRSPDAPTTAPAVRQDGVGHFDHSQKCEGVSHRHADHFDHNRQDAGPGMSRVNVAGRSNTEFENTPQAYAVSP
jgi:hypothetical protein